jgi:hypothetical protein
MTDFVAYLQSLAQEGETTLLVRQKPKLQDGAPTFHADGTIKCSWPALLPSTKIAAGWSVYGNTGLYVLERIKDRVSASAVNCDFVSVMVLDDVGSKVKTPPLLPTWIMETSEGNYQWGYVFSEQPSKSDFSAAIKAIADAGFTDKGAINPVRNFRLPGSVNLKPGKNNFASVLSAFNPEREYTLSQICEALGVTPAAPDTAYIRKLNIADDGQDSVFAYLKDNAQITEPCNQEGWCGVVCPNAAEHSDGSVTGRYHPANRSFVCFHEHCGDWDSKRYLDWVQAQGGPTVEPGLRAELLAKVMAPALAKLSPSDMFSHDAEQIIAEVERKELGRIEKAAWYERFAYIQDDESYFDLQDRREVSRQTFNALFRHISCKSIHTGRKVEASVCFDENRQTMGAKALVGITYAAGESVFVARDGDVYGNRWRDARPTYAAGNVQRWLAHCENLIPDEKEREHVLNVMAFKTQHPKIKINHAILHAGDQGSGKDTLWAPFIWAVCGPHLKNRGLMDNDSISSQWGYQLESEILIINELKEPDARERRALANKLKPIIAAPPEMLPINRKGLHPYMMANRIFVLAFSNDAMPISLDSQDRRWFCIWSHATRMEEKEASDMWAWYQSGGFEAIAAWLHNRDVTAFNPAAIPMTTEFKLNLVEHGMSSAEAYLVDMMRLRVGEFSKGVIGSSFSALCDRVASSAPNGAKIPQAALLHALKEAGWVDKGRIASADYPSKKHIFCHPELNELSKSELRRMVEQAPIAKLSSVR